MATQSVVNVGTQPNDATGDLFRDAFIKINTNFSALFSGTFPVVQLVVGSPTGGSEGAGSINAQSIFIQGVSVPTVVVGSFTATATGFSGTAPTGTANYRIIGNVCTLSIPTLLGTSNAVTFTVTGLPAAIVPATISTHFAVGATDNGSEVGASNVQVIAGSNVLIYANNGSTSGWTATGGKAGGFSTITYLLD
jgi:hypothetical protein